MMGERGPAPKRKSQRLGHISTAERQSVKKAVAVKPTVPKSNPKWHKVAKQWFDSLEDSGQSQFYSSSDWMSAYALAESMSREFMPQPVTIGGETVLMELPPKGASVTAWLKGFASLLACEGDRRRVGLELQQPKPTNGGPSDVSWIEDARRRIHSAS